MDKMETLQAIALSCIIILLRFLVIKAENSETENGIGYRIEGKVDVHSIRDKRWMAHTSILVDGGLHLGFLRDNATFVINGLKSGSYLVEVSNPDFLFEPARIDITSKGKIRARKVNHIQPSIVKTLPYPIEFRERLKAKYFQEREQWRITDLLMNPMVLTMVLPLIVIMILPRLMNTADPETQKEMQTQMNSFGKSNMPDFSVSEYLASIMGGGSEKKAIKSKSSGKMKR